MTAAAAEREKELQTQKTWGTLRKILLSSFFSERVGWGRWRYVVRKLINNNEGGRT
jgi:hypothetical protein